VGQEFFINSQELEDKIRQLLPSQGGAGAGFDLSASTQIIPIIDLTEIAEGSSVRPDLQTALSHARSTGFSVTNATSTVVNNTGYWRIFGSADLQTTTGGGISAVFTLNDGSTLVNLNNYSAVGTDTDKQSHFIPFDFNIFLRAGESLQITASSTVIMSGSFRQLATIDGILINP